MAIRQIERFASPSGMTQHNKQTKDKYSTSYIVEGDAGEDENAIYAHLLVNVPTTKDDLIREKIDLERAESPNWWNARAFYTHPQNPSNIQNPNPGDPARITIRSAGGATQKLLQSREFVGEAVDPDFTKKWELATSTDKIKRLIGWKITPDGSNNVEGYEIPLGGVEIQVQLSVDAATVSGGFLVSVAAHAATQAVNLNPWQGYAAKTLRLINFSATPRNDTNPSWDIVYTFDFSPRQTVTVDDLSIVKEGQHYLDIITEYRPVDADDNFTLPFVIRMATHKIRPEIDYATELGI